MGELEGVRGAWGYPEGGMGAVSGAIAKAALAAGAHIFTDQEAGGGGRHEKRIITSTIFMRIALVYMRVYPPYIL
jgi:hypothetical protein